MKKIALLILCLTTIASFSQNDWEDVGGMSSLGSHRFISMKLTSDGIPVLAYRSSSSNDYKLMVQKYSAADYNWIYIGNSISVDGADFVSLDLDPISNHPVVVYSDKSEGGKASVQKYNGTSWEYLGTPGFTTDQVVKNSIALASDGTPYIAYVKFIGGGVFVEKFNGTNWELVGTSVDNTGGRFMSLAMGPNNTPYVAYNNQLDQNDLESGQINVKKFNGVTWELVGPANFKGAQKGCGYLCLKFSDSGTPYISFTDGDGDSNLGYNDESGSASALSVLKFDGTNWVPVGNYRFTEGKVRYPTLALHGETPYVGFEDRSTGEHKASVMKFDGSDWVYVGSPRFTNNNTHFTDVEVDANQNVYLGYVNKHPSYSNRTVHAKKFADGNGNNPNPVSTNNWDDYGIKIYPNPASNYVMIENIKESSLIKILDITGKVLHESKSANSKSHITLNNLYNGIYFINIISQGNFYTQKLIIQNN